MKKPVLVSLAIGVLIALIVLIFLVVQKPHSSDNTTLVLTGNLNTYDEEAERRAEALSDSGIISADVVVSTGATEVMNPKNVIPDATSEKEAPVGKLIEK